MIAAVVVEVVARHFSNLIRWNTEKNAIVRSVKVLLEYIWIQFTSDLTGKSVHAFCPLHFHRAEQPLCTIAVIKRNITVTSHSALSLQPPSRSFSIIACPRGPGVKAGLHPGQGTSFSGANDGGCHSWIWQKEACVIEKQCWSELKRLDDLVGSLRGHSFKAPDRRGPPGWRLRNKHFLCQWRTFPGLV